MLNHYGDLNRSFSVINQLRRRMDRLFEEGVQASGRGYPEEPERVWSRGRFPGITFADAGATLVLEAEMPGLGDKDVQLSIQKDVLTLAGERKADAPEGYYVHRQERSPIRFSRSFTLPCKVDPDKSTATLKDGVLTVTLAKIPDEQPRQIAIKVNA
jgi:HSP20 family protein